MTLIFLRVGDKDHHAILNTDNICYMEGYDVTDEWPGGSKTKLMTTGGSMGLHIPYKEIADQIAKSIEQGYVLNEQIAEARRKLYLEDQRKVMKEVIGGMHHD
jgi:hypothetical protein